MYIKEFRKEILRQELSINTADGYVRDIKGFMSFYEVSTGENFNPKEIIDLDIKTFKAYLQTNLRQNPKTINRKLSVIRKYFSFLVIEDIIEKSPANEVKMVEYQRRRVVKIIEDSDLYKVRRKVYAGGNKRDIAIVEVIKNTGVRASELCGIHIEDVKFIDGQKKASLVVYSGKGSKYRELPLNNDARKAILEYLEVRPVSNNPHLFLGERGPLTRNGVYKILKKYAYSARIEQLHPHQLRHKFAQILIDKGHSEATVGELLGHEHPNSTRVYTNPSEKNKERVVESLSTMD